MTDWKVERRRMMVAMGGRCQFRDPETGEQCDAADLDDMELHHLTDTPLGDDYNRFAEITEWLRTGKLPDNEELRCSDHHKVENAKDPTQRARWLLKIKVKRRA